MNSTGITVHTDISCSCISLHTHTVTKATSYINDQSSWDVFYTVYQFFVPSLFLNVGRESSVRAGRQTRSPLPSLCLVLCSSALTA